MTSPNEATPIHLEISNDSLYLTAGELLMGMAGADEDVIVLASDDEEGNDFRPIAQVRRGLYLPQQTWFGYFLEHPHAGTAPEDRMLYEQTTVGDERLVEATLLASVDPGVSVEDPLTWLDLRGSVSASDPESVIILRHHTSSDLPPSYSPLVEVDTAHYLQDLKYNIEHNGGNMGFSAERIVKLDYESEEDRMYVEDALANPNTQPAYYFWPLN